MQQFVLIFRQPPDPQLSPDDLERRSSEIRAWALAQNAAGRELDPRMLGPAGVWWHPQGRIAASAGDTAQPLIALLFFSAHDADDAATVAQTHPGVRFGSSLELRSWAPPAQPAQS